MPLQSVFARYIGSSVGRGGRPGRLPGAQAAGGGGRGAAGGARFQYKKGRGQERRQGNGGLVVGGGWRVEKKCENRQIFFGREFWRLVCVLKKGSPNIPVRPPRN
jgi:hypothetical protein